MGHKDRKRINLWLRDMRAKQYVEWRYSDHFLEKTKPAIYYLGLNGVRYLRRQAVTSDDGEEFDAYPLEEVRKRYRDNDRSESFIARSVLLAACCIDLNAHTNQTVRYTRILQAEYADPDHAFHWLAESELVIPHLCIRKRDSAKSTKDAGDDGEGIVTNYLLEIFDMTLPRYRVKNKLKQYVTYLVDDEWGSGDNDPTPIILLVCSRTTDLIYAKRRTKKLLEDEYYDDVPEDIHVRFTTIEQLQKHGITAKIWEEGRKVYGL